MRHVSRTAQQRVNDWNIKHAIGTPVWLRHDDGRETATMTRSAASLLGGHTPVIWVDGEAGCWALERVRPR